MVKLMVLLRRKPGMSMREFMEHYENVHIPLVKKVLPSMGSRYVRNYMTGSALLTDQAAVNPAPYFDVITELRFDEQHEYDDFMASLNDPEIYRVLQEDQKKFLDTSVVQIFPVTAVGDE